MALTLASNAITFTDNTSLSSGIIGTAQLSAGAVTTSVLASGAVTTEKIDPYLVDLFASTTAWSNKYNESNSFATFTGAGYRLVCGVGELAANNFPAYIFPFDTVLTHVSINFDTDSLISNQTCTFVLSVWRHSSPFKDFDIEATAYPSESSDTVQIYSRTSSVFSPGATPTRGSGIIIDLMQNNLGIPFSKNDIMTARIKGVTSSSLYSDLEFTIYFYGISKYGINLPTLNFP